MIYLIILAEGNILSVNIYLNMQKQKDEPATSKFPHSNSIKKTKHKFTNTLEFCKRVFE